MEYQITEQSNWHRVVQFAVPAADVKPQLEQKYAEAMKSVRLEGFRKGKVPPGLVKKMFGKSIESEIFNGYVRQALDRLFKENTFDYLNTPYVQDLAWDEEKGLSFALHFDIRPDFQVDGYAGMQVERTLFEASDEDLEHTLADLQSRQAMIYTVEGEAQPGHFIMADLQEVDRTGVPMVGHKYENEVIWLHDDRPEITSQLAGVKAGDERRMTLQPQAETGSQEAPAEKHYLVAVREVKERRLPELDDEFAKDLGAFSSLEELKADIRARLQAQAEHQTHERFRDALADELIKQTPIEAPPSMVDNYLAMLIADVKRKSKESVDEAHLAEHYRPSAVHGVKWYLIRDRLISQQGLAVSDEELESALSAMAAAGEEGAQRAEQIRSKKEERERFRDALEDDKVYAFLSQKAKVTEVRRSLYQHHDHEHPSAQA
ncbi:MAG TPA: trigger factor [bacterium]|nr:trigger factor [bacterium]HPM60490.1 trigger factor [bacterium]